MAGVAHLAEVCGLRVPARTLLSLDTNTPSDDHNDELADLLKRSVGVNLGFEVVQQATDFVGTDIPLVDCDTAAQIVWLDGLVMNPDRTLQNPNLLWAQNRLWLIDHGSCLGFQYRWTSVQEASPRRPWPLKGHVLFPRATQLAEWDELLAERVTRDVLRAAIELVPDAFLTESWNDPPGDLDRRREAYVAFLWKRLRAPRPFV